MNIVNDPINYIQKFKSGDLDIVPLACVLIECDEKCFSVLLDLDRMQKVEIPIEHVVQVLDQGSLEIKEMRGRQVFLHLNVNKADPLVTSLARGVYVAARKRQETYSTKCKCNEKDKSDNSTDNSTGTAQPSLIPSKCATRCRHCRFCCDGYSTWCDIMTAGAHRYACCTLG